MGFDLIPPTPFVLVHSPLVGPSTWSWVAAELAKRGHRAIVPSLTGVEHTSGSPFDFCVRAAREAIPTDQPVFLVGHSGSGVLLPFIGDQLPIRPIKYVFVDAGLPPESGRVLLAEDEFRSFLDGMVDAEGMLPRWSQWWGEEMIQSMVPDADRRAVLEADMPGLPMRYYDQAVDVPPAWSQVPAAYLLLSESYRNAADEARSLGWPVSELPGGHLHLVVDPSAVAEALLELTTSP